jgi:chemotaxis-related protein WspB
MLVIVLRVAARRFGIDARDALAVVPFVPLVPVPDAPPWLAGLLRHRDRLVPVVDLATLARGVAAAHRLSTRIVIVGGDDREPLGLLAEGVTETVRVDADRLREAPVDGAAWVGPIALDRDDALQLVRWPDLLPAAVRAALDRTASACGAP